MSKVYDEYEWALTIANVGAGVIRRAGTLQTASTGNMSCGRL